MQINNSFVILIVVSLRDLWNSCPQSWLNSGNSSTAVGDAAENCFEAGSDFKSGTDCTLMPPVCND